MEGFLPIIFFWIIFTIITNVAKKSKQAGNQRQPGANPRQGNAAARQSPARTAPNPPSPARAEPALVTHTPDIQPTLTAPRDSQSHPFEAHMHEAEMDQEGVGTEGMDCGHDCMLRDTAEEPEADFLPLTEEDPDEKARMLLQGVIFSEVLGRRRVRRYGGKRA